MLKSLFRCWLPMYLAVVGLSLTTSVAVSKPSFPCSNRMSPDERAICQDPRLTTLDHIANQGYMFLRAKLGKVEANRINLPLIRQRQKCKSDVVCIENAQRESIRIFNKNGARLEIPDLSQEISGKSELNVPEPPKPQAAIPSPQEQITPSQPAPASTTPAPEPAPPAKSIASSETDAVPEQAPEPAGATEASTTPATPPAKPAATENSEPSTQAETEEPVDRPPVESEAGTTQADANAGASQADAGAAAEATPNLQGAREWRPEIEKELRAESELESSATDLLTKEIAEEEQIKPLTREQRQAVESTRSKHRTAFMLATILFALVVAYAISKLKRDPGLITPSTNVTPPARTEKNTNPFPKASAPPSAQRSTAAGLSGNDQAPTSGANVRPTIETIAASAPTQPPPGAWVWTKYKARI